MAKPARHSSRLPQSSWTIVLLGALCVVTPFAIDMYLPAFSIIAAEYKTTPSAISLTLSTYFIGFALGQLIYGPLLDRFGRKRPLYVGLVAYILCSIGCALAPSLHIFIALRFLEALGGCVAQVGALAMVRDFFPVRDSARIFSLLFLMIGVSPLLAPTVGSLLIAHVGWRSIFVLLAAIAFAILVTIIFLLPEGHQPDPSVSLHPLSLLGDFWDIFKTLQFTTYALAGSFSFAGLFAFVAGSPLIFMDGFHMGARGFGMTFAGLVGGFIGSNQVNVLLLRRFRSQQIFAVALAVQVAMGILLYAGMLTHLLGLPSTLALFFCFLSCIGLTNPNSAALALAPFSRNAGRASALYGCIQTGTGAIVSMGIGVLGSGSVGVLVSTTAVAGFAALLIGQRRLGAIIMSEEPDAVAIH